MITAAAFSITLLVLMSLPALPTGSGEQGAGNPGDAMNLSVMNSPSSGGGCQPFRLDFSSPLQPLAFKLKAVTLKATVSKVLNGVPDGAPKDTLAIGIRVEDTLGRRCWLICSVSPSSAPAQRHSDLLGDYFLCGTVKGLGDVQQGAGNVSVVMGLPDFFPALMLAARANCIGMDILSLYVDCIYPFSETSVCSEDSVVICASLNSSAGFEATSISVDGEELALAGNCGCTRSSGKSHEVAVSGISHAALFPVSIGQTFSGLHF